MGQNEIEQDVKPCDFPVCNQVGEPSLWREVAEKFGVEVVIFMSKEAGGTKIDIPSYKRVIARATDRYCKNVR